MVNNLAESNALLYNENCNKKITFISPIPTAGAINIDFGQNLSATIISNVLGQKTATKTINNLDAISLEIYEPTSIYCIEIINDLQKCQIITVIKI